MTLSYIFINKLYILYAIILRLVYTFHDLIEYFYIKYNYYTLLIARSFFDLNYLEQIFLVFFYEIRFYKKYFIVNGNNIEELSKYLKEEEIYNYRNKYLIFNKNDLYLSFVNSIANLIDRFEIINKRENYYPFVDFFFYYRNKKESKNKIFDIYYWDNNYINFEHPNENDLSHIDKTIYNILLFNIYVFFCKKKSFNLKLKIINRIFFKNIAINIYNNYIIFLIVFEWLLNKNYENMNSLKKPNKDISQGWFNLFLKKKIEEDLDFKNFKINFKTEIDLIDILKSLKWENELNKLKINFFNNTNSLRLVLSLTNYFPKDHYSYYIFMFFIKCLVLKTFNSINILDLTKCDNWYTYINVKNFPFLQKLIILNKIQLYFNKVLKFKRKTHLNNFYKFFNKNINNFYKFFFCKYVYFLKFILKYNKVFFKKYNFNNLIKSVYYIKYNNSSVNKFIELNKLNNYNFFFLRKTRIFNKSRYSRNRQLYRTGVYWCLWLNIIIVYGLYFIFYHFTFNFSYIWWFCLILFYSMIFSKILKYKFYKFYNIISEYKYLIKWYICMLFKLFEYFDFFINSFFLKNNFFSSSIHFLFCKLYYRHEKYPHFFERGHFYEKYQYKYYRSGILNEPYNIYNVTYNIYCFFFKKLYIFFKNFYNKFFVLYVYNKDEEYNDGFGQNMIVRGIRIFFFLIKVNLKNKLYKFKKNLEI